MFNALNTQSLPTQTQNNKTKLTFAFYNSCRALARSSPDFAKKGKIPSDEQQKKIPCTQPRDAPSLREPHSRRRGDGNVPRCATRHRSRDRERFLL